MTLKDKMLAVIADINASVAEREELVEMIAIALLTRKNLFILGAPGQAKSYAINLFRQHITGARQFERLLSKQSDEEQLFGRVDLASLLPGSVPQAVLDKDDVFNHQRFNLRVMVDAVGGMKDEPATWERLRADTEKLESYKAALAALHQKGERLAPGIQRRADDLGAFSDEDALFRLQLIAQLGFGQSGI